MCLHLRCSQLEIEFRHVLGNCILMTTSILVTIETGPLIIKELLVECTKESYVKNDKKCHYISAILSFCVHCLNKQREGFQWGLSPPSNRNRICLKQNK